MPDKTMTVEQAIEFLKGLQGESGIMVTSLIVSVEVSADDLPVDEPETNSRFQDGLRGS